MSTVIWRGGAWWEERMDRIWYRWDRKERKWRKEKYAPCPPSEYLDVPEDDKHEVDLELFKVVVEHLRHNLEMFWQHSLLFIAIQGALLTVYTSKDSSKPRQQALIVFGVLLSAYWGWIAWSRWRLIDLWREEVKRLDLVVDRHLAFFWVENRVRRHPVIIPAFSGLLLPLIIAIGWIVQWKWRV